MSLIGSEFFFLNIKIDSKKLLAITMVFAIFFPNVIKAQSAKYGVAASEVDVALHCYWSTKGSQYFHWKWKIFFSKKSGKGVVVNEGYFDYLPISLVDTSIDKYTFKPAGRAYLDREFLARQLKIEIDRQTLMARGYFPPSGYPGARGDEGYSCDLIPAEAIKQNFVTIENRHAADVEKRKFESEAKAKEKEKEIQNKIINQKI